MEIAYCRRQPTSRLEDQLAQRALGQWRASEPRIDFESAPL